MICLNTYQREHPDTQNIEGGYAFGYSYITRKSKLNAAIEWLTLSSILGCLFCYVAFVRNPIYIELLPYIILGKDSLMILDNIYLIKKCKDDRLNEILKTGAEIFHWLTYVIFIDFLDSSYMMLVYISTIRVLIEIGIFVRFIIHMKKEGSDIYMSTGQGLIWAIQIFFFSLWLNRYFKDISAFFFATPYFCYIVTLLIAGVSRLTIEMFKKENGMAFKRIYFVCLLELKFYFIIMFLIYKLSRYVERGNDHYFVCGFVLILVMIVLSLFYGAVLIFGPIDQSNKQSPVEESFESEDEDNEERRSINQLSYDD